MKKTLILILLIIFLSFMFLWGEEGNYSNNSYARLSFLTGNIFVQRSADLGYEEGVVNMPLAAGDRLGTTDGRAEIYLGNSNYIRLDENTKIDLIRMPQGRDELTEIQLWAGSLYLSAGSLSREKDIVIHTPDSSVYILERGLYRIDVWEGEDTEIFVFKGVVEAAGANDSLLLQDAQRVKAIRGNFTSRPASFMAAAEDSFDRWNEDRDNQVRRNYARDYLPQELNDFGYELEMYGEWAYVPPYGRVWVPGGIDRHWRPYYHGRWIWLIGAGWTWLPYEPWGWVTCHYGRWHWSVHAGWYWIPTRFWGPAWVHWYHGYNYVGWVPLSYYNRPIVVINNIFYDHHTSGYYPHNSRALTVIHKDQLSRARNVSRVALNPDSLSKVGKIQLSSRAPQIQPVRSKVTAESLQGNKVLLRKSDSPTMSTVSSSAASQRVRRSESSLSTIKSNSLSRENELTSRKIRGTTSSGTVSNSSSKVSSSRVPTTKEYSSRIPSTRFQSTTSQKGTVTTYETRNIRRPESGTYSSRIKRERPSSTPSRTIRQPQSSSALGKIYNYISRSPASKTRISSSSRPTTIQRGTTIKSRISSSSKGRSPSSSSSRISSSSSKRRSTSSSSSKARSSSSSSGTKKVKKKN